MTATGRRGLMVFFFCRDDCFLYAIHIGKNFNKLLVLSCNRLCRALVHLLGQPFWGTTGSAMSASGKVA